MNALLFTDLVDSTALVERLGDVRAAEVFAEHDRRARAFLARHDGREIDRTDGFFLLFTHAADAVRYVLAYHAALADLGIHARAGLHFGSVTLHENAPEDIVRGARPVDVEGLAKPIAARIMALARPQQTLVTAAACAALADALPEGAQIESHGHYRLKGIQEPVEVFEVAMVSTPFTPPADVEKAYRVVRIGDTWSPVREVRHNLPAERDTFVGRTAELRALALRLDAGARLLTVSGPGGTGKTRFVRRYGAMWLGDWPGGVYFADLCEARTLDGIFFALASALDVRLGKEPAVQLRHAIRSRGRCLVILDNFEQVVQHAAATVGQWLDGAADAAFVVTSRERLHLFGEEVFPLEPLRVENEGIELFAARARAQVPDFVLTSNNRAAVAGVVSLLDGLPLAIELAAARVRVLSPAQLLERMRDRFGILAGARGAAARQATLRAAIDWSWDLLTPWEQAAFAQCSVFEGGFTLEAAEVVLELSAWPEAPPAMDIVQALVDKSLLRTWTPAEHARFALDEPFFGMYLSIHEYSAEKLDASPAGTARAAQERHAVHFARLGTDDAVQALSRHGGVKRYHSLALELDNLVAACGRAVDWRRGDLAVPAYRATWEVLDLQGPFALGASLGDRVLAIEGLDAALLATARIVRARVARRSGLMEEAEKGFTESLALARSSGDRRREGSTLGQLGIVCREQGRMDEACVYYDGALAIHREIGNRIGEGIVLLNLGNLYAEQGRMDEALEHFAQALAVDREVGNRVAEGLVLGNMGTLCHEQGHIDAAQDYLQQALAIHREVGNRNEEGIVFANLGGLHLGEGRNEDAQSHYEGALAIAREAGHLRLEGHVLGRLGRLHFGQGRMAEAQVHYEQALAIDRAVGNRRSQGATLGDLGELAIRQGRAGDARELLNAGEALLRAVGDRANLSNLLCIQAETEFVAGRPDTARAKLAEADALAQAMGTAPDAEIFRRIVALRQSFGEPGPNAPAASPTAAQRNTLA